MALSTFLDMTSASLSKWVCCRFSFMHLIAFGSFSANTHKLAPLLSASIPMPPDPLNKSRNTAPGKSGCSILNRVSLILSVVGLVSKPGGDFRINLLALPAITLIYSAAGSSVVSATATSSAAGSSGTRSSSKSLLLREIFFSSSLKSTTLASMI